MTEPPAATAVPPQPGLTAALVLADGTVFWGRGVGAAGTVVGEVCFNTSMTGYQEILTDPSYAGQIITFTFPHIGNVGTNDEDAESVTPAALGLVLCAEISGPSNFRAQRHLDEWLKARGLVGIGGVDTRRLTRRIRDRGAPNGALSHAPDGIIDLAQLQATAKAWPGLEGMDLARQVSCTQAYHWNQSRWSPDSGYGVQREAKYHVVAVDYGAKQNILRCLASAGCRVTVVPATATTQDIWQHKPDGIFLSNGPGDPAATGEYAVPVIRDIVQARIPLFGICLGHQMLALALGARTIKMHMGHRGANHPVKNLGSGKVEITTQNHGFVVQADSLPSGVVPTHLSLFDGTLEGLKIDGAPAFSVQYHPEASPGPQDSHHLFRRFVALMEANA